ncbi:hypothetical protein BST81_00965 [Leptolyngbya sp. 'hensonii']|uniref:DUF1995 family protein n=1 Tax=Leptolyngbya sp. 'hensonii' TaxID=1922337 RepID=UPI00094F934C|nr:DUF1995 family protein [Leptolyngbya sp. 'hensonii']OLP20338.1 hypothetical protein BST81_00965 [Leptolyngbya sp. 'hensonii']
MTQLPDSLEAAVVQAKEATRAALADGLLRIQVELVFSELKPMPIARQFLDLFEDLGEHLKVIFPDAGAAALASRDWGPQPFAIRSLSEVKGQPQPEDRLFLLVSPSSVEVSEVEKFSEQVGDRPIIMLNPQLEDAATIGIGYASRQLRIRFLSTFEPCYYLRPLEQAALLRAYPGSWQVWQELDQEYKLVAEQSHKPVGEELDQILFGSPETPEALKGREGFFKGLQRFIKALNQ